MTVGEDEVHHVEKTWSKHPSGFLTLEEDDDSEDEGLQGSMALAARAARATRRRYVWPDVWPDVWPGTNKSGHSRSRYLILASWITHAPHLPAMRGVPAPSLTVGRACTLVPGLRHRWSGRKRTTTLGRTRSRPGCSGALDPRWTRVVITAE